MECARAKQPPLHWINQGDKTLQVHTAPPANPLEGAYRRALTNLVAAVGRPNFPEDLLSFAHDMIRTDHLTVFCQTARGGIRTVIAENTGARAIARAVAERYVRHHWTCDPVQKAFARSDILIAAQKECVLVDIDAADVEHTGYRDECYSSVNLNHRLSIANVRDGKTMRINFYRRRGHDFAPDELDRVMDIANLLMAMVWRHDEDSLAQDGADLEAAFLQRLARIAPGLTPRERQVCALVALGLTSEGIALRLGVGLNTVLTYRKRAYTRLSISSQNELMRCLMS